MSRRYDCLVRVSAAVLVVATELRTVVLAVVAVVLVVGALAGAGVAAAAATAAGCSGAFAEWRFSLAKIVMPPRLVSVTAVASARRAIVDVISGVLARRGRSVMRTR
jgi:hypothetical protein